MASKLISQTPQCIIQISHNAPFYSKNVHISVTKRCIVEYGTGALWDLCYKSIAYQAVDNMAWGLLSKIHVNFHVS